MFVGSDNKHLSVSGKSFALKPKYPPHLETRKIYNATFFRDEQYHHEIANHYRDFKRRPRIHRRRRNINTRNRKASLDILGTDRYEYREELPMAVHSFPRFTLVYTPPRGRQCQCESQPPDETNNDSVRRIRAARSCEELRALVQRYSGLIAKREQHCRQHKSRQGKYEKHETRQTFPKETESGSKQQATTQRQQTQRQQQQQQNQQQEQKQGLGNLESVATACGKQKPTHSNDCSNRDKTTIASTELYLQLASEHYERVYLANIKYLESIPERNNDSQTTKVSASSENNWNYSRLASAKSNASNSSTNTDETTPRRTCELNFGIANLIRLIGRKRSFRIGCNDSTENESVYGKIRNWDIRINITHAAGDLAKQTERKHLKQQRNTANADSMHDFLNANTAKTIQFFETTTFNNNNHSINNNSLTNGLVPSAEWSTEHLHNIIDNLTQLDLNALNSSAIAGSQQSLIPRITLTNYCDFNKNQYYESENPHDFNNIDNQALKSAPSACNSTLLLKPTKFLDKATLDIPSENNYRSEARPP